MTIRTYLPFLRVLLKQVCGYIREHEDKIKDNVGEGNVNKVDAALTACSILVAALDAVIPQGT